MVREISFKNFKIFKGRQTIELKPITVLIGKNNSGKSAALRLPVLIAEGLEGRPMNWTFKIGEDSLNQIELGSDFKDLIYNRNAAGIIEFHIKNEKESIELVANEEYGILEYKLNGKDIDVNDNSFKGFLVNGKRFDNLKLNIDYIGAIRVVPNADYIHSNIVIENIGVKGQFAYPVLIKDLKGNQQLIQKVSDWYAENFEGWKLEVIESKSRTETKYEIAITNAELKAINIKQTGQGIHQVLPLIVRSYMDVDQPTLTIIEEPETHLHPAAHAVLASRFVKSYLDDNNKHYLIETHSQNFVLRLRRLVAEGKLDKDQVAIYYVDFDKENNESNISEIKIDEGGGVEWWPSGIFSETSDETRAIYNAQLNDAKNVG